jgi:hypothetical protein
MVDERPTFGRRGRPVKTHLPAGLPGGQSPLAAGRKRSIAIALATAGALAAAGVHFAEGGPSTECTPIPVPPSGSPAKPTALPVVVPTPGANIGAVDGTCPPGYVRTHSSTRYGSGIRLLRTWSWSSGGSSSYSGRSMPFAGSVRRGGFGSTGSFHASGGS